MTAGGGREGKGDAYGKIRSRVRWGIGLGGGVGLAGRVRSDGVVGLSERVGSDRGVESMKLESLGGVGAGQRFESSKGIGSGRGGGVHAG